MNTEPIPAICVDSEGRLYAYHNVDVIQKGDLAGNYYCVRCQQELEG